jgi:hypothetical protein
MNRTKRTASASVPRAPRAYHYDEHAPGLPTTNDAVIQLVIGKVEHRPAHLDVGDYPYLPETNVKTTSAADYAVLVWRHDDRRSYRQPGAPQVLLAHHLRQLKLPAFLREYDKSRRRGRA